MRDGMGAETKWRTRASELRHGAGSLEGSAAHTAPRGEDHRKEVIAAKRDVRLRRVAQQRARDRYRMAETATRVRRRLQWRAA